MSTASRALSPENERVSSSTREKVKNVADSIGYFANSAARGLASGMTHTIAVIVPDIENPYFASILKGVQVETQMSEVAVVVADSFEDPGREELLLRRFSSQADGVILCSSRLKDEMILSLARPESTVLVSRQVPGLVSVTLDEAQILRLAIQHLYAFGHSRIAYVRGPDSSWANTMRRQLIPVVESELEGLEVLDLGPYKPVFNSGPPAADRAVSLGATALVACNDLVALGAMQRMSSRKISVPDEFSILGIDDSAGARISNPSLTSVHTPHVRLGHSAASLVREQLRGAEVSSVSDHLDIELRIRDSTAIAPSAAQTIAL